MAKHLQNELEKLKKKLLSLSTVVEENVGKAVCSVGERNERLAQEVIDSDFNIDELEIEVEEDCLKILALHQPVAVDLRFIVAVLKINNDLERIADIAVNIAERSIYLSRKEPIEMPFDFDQMTKKTRSMLKRSLDSLIQHDPEVAHQICLDDDEVDAINRKMYDQVYDGIRKSPELVKPLISCLAISRHLERIADYATNIAEDTIYMVEGNIVRHKPEDYSNEN
jgi:phosphate transport system protein